jgi:hypothetical protein
VVDAKDPFGKSCRLKAASSVTFIYWIQVVVVAGFLLTLGTASMDLAHPIVVAQSHRVSQSSCT